MQTGQGRGSARGSRRAIQRQAIYAGLDLGTTKAACLIAQVDGVNPDGSPLLRVIGSGLTASRGVRAGAIIDLDAAEDAVRSAVAQAEGQAGLTLQSIILALNCANPESHCGGAEVPVAGREIDERDVRNAVAAARAKCSVRGADIMFSAPVSYAVDHTHDILDPRGMIGSRLGARVLVVSAMRGPIENLELCVQRCHLDVQDRVLSGLASGIATTVPDERKLGTVVVDIGGGTTSLTVFAQGQMIHTDRIALGGNHITTDVARGLSTTVSQAERLKTLYGSVIPGAHDERDTIVVTRVGENDAYSHIKAPRKSLTSIIRPRAEEILEIVRDRLVNCGYDKISGRGLVITGGSAPLNGLRELASQIFGRQARLGRPLRMSGLTEANNGGAFAACAGLVLRAALEANRTGAPEVLPLEEPVAPWPVKKLFGVSRWIKERF